MGDAFTKIFKHRSIIAATTATDLKSKYAGSILGYMWLFLYPLIFLSIYALIYIFIFKVRLEILSPYDYVLLIFAGLIPFLSFSEALGRGVHAVTANANLRKNTLFPIELIPVTITLSAQVIQVVGFILIVLVLLFRHKLGILFPLVFLIWFLQILFTLGVIWILSALNVFFRDLGNITALVVLMLMMISPIAYTEDMIPPRLRMVLYFNPLYYMIMLYQKVLIFNQFDLKLFSIFSVLSLISYFLGYFLFIRLKGVFSDYV